MQINHALAYVYAKISNVSFFYNLFLIHGKPMRGGRRKEEGEGRREKGEGRRRERRREEERG
jgi:hypothetical protein